LSLLPDLVDAGAQPERTALSWLRTAASITFASLLLFRYLIEVGNTAQAFLVGGAAVLLAPTLLIAGLNRAKKASINWDVLTPANPLGTLAVSLAVMLVGLIVALTAALN
jgi:uncharacterized membrane protein YidH (DUF202 family)